MKFFMSKEWVLNKAKEETGFDVVAGRQGRGVDQSTDRGPDAVEQVAFSTLVELLRRDRGLSVSDLAEQARVDAIELVSIERLAAFLPRPRTVHQLAKFFGLPEKMLFELSSLTTVHTPEVREAAVRFAANAKRMTELDLNERHALNEFVKFLSSRK